MSSSDEDVRELVSLATLGEGVLREADEHRILKVLLTAGFSPLEAREKIDAALAATSSRRAQDAVPAPVPGAEATSASASEGGASATPEAVEKAITRSFKRPTRRAGSGSRPGVTGSGSRPGVTGSGSRPGVVRSTPAPSEKPKEPLLPGRSPSSPDEEKPLAVCSVCLASISHEDARAGRAEVLADGTHHCRACVSKLRAGLLCKVCYKRIDRAELLDGRAQLHADRAVHITCAPR